ncbi:MAG: IclR family transcriptional regulator [Chloroflexi bacterium]|nr:IclR family transcriptional regulator [Chloroflexota bacterium]
MLLAFSRERTEVSPSELARTLGLPRTVVVRILNTLEQAGFLERVPGVSLYRIGLSAFEVGALYLANNPLVAVADELLADLVDKTGHTAYLGALYGNEAVILSLREGRSPVRFQWSAGDRLPATTTALGKAILMHLATSDVDRILGRGRLPGLTERSIKTRGELDRELHAARDRGWTVAIDESYPGVCAVGAPILDGSGSPLAGMSISFLNYPPNPDLFDQLGVLVCSTAETVSRRIAAYHAYGHRSPLGRPPPAQPASGRQAPMCGI